MKKANVHAAAGVFLVMLFGHSAGANSIGVSVTGTPVGPIAVETAPNGQIVEVGWSQTNTWANLAIQGVFCCDDPNSTITAFLTNSIGPGTTGANVLATATIKPVNEPWGQLPALYTTLFSDLMLGPGSYFLIVGGTPSGWFWPINPDQTLSGAIPKSIETGPGMTYLGSSAVFNATPGSIDTSFIPDSTGWRDWGQDPIFQVTGDPTPEPTSFVLLGVALGLLFGMNTRRSWLPSTVDSDGY